jgi:hypothetical protein
MLAIGSPANARGRTQSYATVRSRGRETCPDRNFAQRIDPIDEPRSDQPVCTSIVSFDKVLVQ